MPPGPIILPGAGPGADDGAKSDTAPPRSSGPKFPTVYTYDFFKMEVVITSENEDEKKKSFRPPQVLIDWESEKKTIVA